MGNDECKLLLIGLDNSGKTTILSKLVNPTGSTSQVTPTVGYNKQKFSRHGITFEVFDMSGESKYRDLWQSNAYEETNKISGIIFVADSSDRMRLNVARSQLEMILDNGKIPSSIPYLFYANKSDVQGGCKPSEVSEILKLKSINREAKVFESCGVSGAGIQAGIQWLSLVIKNNMQRQAEQS